MFYLISTKYVDTNITSYDQQMSYMHLIMVLIFYIFVCPEISGTNNYEYVVGEWLSDCTLILATKT